MSTTSRVDKGGHVARSHQAPMSVKRFQDVLRQVGLGEDEDWVNASEKDFEQAIDDALLEVCQAHNNVGGTVRPTNIFLPVAR